MSDTACLLEIKRRPKGEATWTVIWKVWIEPGTTAWFEPDGGYDTERYEWQFSRTYSP